MKNPYNIGTLAAVLGASLLHPLQDASAADGDKLPSISNKYDASRCYWLEAKITAEGLCGEKMQPDMPRIIEEAENGNALAAFRLGQLYARGSWGVTQDFKESEKWFLLSAKGGFRTSQLKLALMYEFGRGAEKNLNEALYWYKAAAEHGLYADLEEKIASIEERLTAD
jgi:TPR repeat protein